MVTNMRLYLDLQTIDSPRKTTLAAVLLDYEKKGELETGKLFVEAASYSERALYYPRMCLLMETFYVAKELRSAYDLERYNDYLSFLADSKLPALPEIPKMQFTFILPDEIGDAAFCLDRLLTLSEQERAEEMKEILLAYMQLEGEIHYIKWQTVWELHQMAAQLLGDVPADITLNDRIELYLQVADMPDDPDRVIEILKLSLATDSYS